MGVIVVEAFGADWPAHDGVAGLDVLIEGQLVGSP